MVVHCALNDADYVSHKGTKDTKDFKGILRTFDSFATTLRTLRLNPNILTAKDAKNLFLEVP